LAAIDNSASANFQLPSTDSGLSADPALTDAKQNSVKFNNLKAEVQYLTDLGYQLIYHAQLCSVLFTAEFTIQY